MTEHISYDELSRAYFDCRRHKRTKPSALKYELDYEMRLYKLWEELNDGTYEVGRSSCFCVSRPKVREVFAASFRDRIVHHLLMNRMLSIFENNFIDDTYNCRVGKGVFYGVRRLDEHIKSIGKDCWFLKIDLSGFFMSIDKDTLWESTEKLIRERWEYEDIEWWLNLLKKVVYNRPELKCERRGDLSLWDVLPESKSLFHTNGKGLPIGNLTSQILANHYLTGFDKWLSPQVSGYSRYVDDIVLLDKDKNKLLTLLNPIREELSKLSLKLNPKKIVLQRADKGILFTGYVVKPWGLYAGDRLRRNAIKLSKRVESIDVHLNRFNSYSGFLLPTLAYAIRREMWQNTARNYTGIYATKHCNAIKKLKTHSK